MGELQPLPFAKCKGGNLTMDLVTGLLRSLRGHGAIWVTIDRLMKTTHFLPIQVIDSVKVLSRLFICEIISLHALSVSIVFDSDPRVTTHFWQSLQTTLGTNLLFSTGYHP